MKWYWWLLLIGCLGIAGAGIWYVTDILPERSAEMSSDQLGSNESSGSTVRSQPIVASVRWDFDGSTWRSNGAPPACAEPLVFKAPADLALATHVLYPGQTRGGNYKPHGGFRFNDSKNNEVSVVVPMDGQLVNGSRYVENGETQYMFDIVNDCGVMSRLDHLLTLTPKFQAIAEGFPAAQENDSRTTRVEPAIAVKAGERLAIAVGITNQTNTFFDWGVYDLRQKNAVSNDTSWAAAHGEDKQLAPYAVCWFDLLSAEDETKARSLPPGDSGSGTTSDYCR